MRISRWGVSPDGRFASKSLITHSIRMRRGPSFLIYNDKIDSGTAGIRSQGRRKYVFHAVVRFDSLNPTLFSNGSVHNRDSFRNLALDALGAFPPDVRREVIVRFPFGRLYDVYRPVLEPDVVADLVRRGRVLRDDGRRQQGVSRSRDAASRVVSQQYSIGEAGSLDRASYVQCVPLPIERVQIREGAVKALHRSPDVGVEAVENR
mmetsp:Transcript_19812/g.48481  ORF Transcript_19812/g.48481 Transcript_19812/m.48481 type:complete len:206 (-) Transcript_19812:1909-2526(-)